MTWQGAQQRQCAVVDSIKRINHRLLHCCPLLALEYFYSTSFIIFSESEWMNDDRRRRAWVVRACALFECFPIDSFIIFLERKWKILLDTEQTTTRSLIGLYLSRRRRRRRRWRYLSNVKYSGGSRGGNNNFILLLLSPLLSLRSSRPEELFLSVRRRRRRRRMQTIHTTTTTTKKRRKKRNKTGLEDLVN